MRVELSVHALVSLIHQEKLGDPHPVFATGGQYVSARQASDGGRAELASAGLVDRGQLADFTAMVSIIQRARREFYGWVTTNAETFSVLAAAHGRNAFAVTRRGDRVGFRRIRSHSLAEALVARLPEVPPGHGESISVRTAEVVRPGPRPVLRRPSGAAGAEQVRRFDALLRAPRQGGAKLYAAGRDDVGNRRRSPAWLTLLDLPEGRWAIYPLGDTINAVAATPALIIAKLTDVLRPSPF